MAIIHVHGPYLFFYVFLIIFPTTASSPDSEALLRLKASFTNAQVLDSWKPETEPCAVNQTWVGILCVRGAVFGLRLGYMGLSGKIDVDALASLSGLRSVAIMSNAFSGPIPDFHRMGVLKGLYLSANQFSGEIPPDYFSKMTGLKKIWLSRNNFSGPIPSSIAQLPQLMELHLDNNHFSGTIPSFEQQNLVSLNVSNNNLEGEIPSGLSRFSRSSFEGNAGLCGGNSGKPCQKSKTSNAIKIAAWCLVGFAALLVLMVVGIYIMRRREEAIDTAMKGNLGTPLDSRSSKGGKRDISSNASGEVIGGSGPRTGSSRRAGSTHGKDVEIINDEKGEFGLGDLMKAAAEVLGNGALGSSYKATMVNGFTVVVKRTKEMNKLGRDKFDFEMRRLGSVRHKNVLTPLAYHYRKDEKLIVSEYHRTGSLMFLLHDDRGSSYTKLDWATRLKIIQGITRGLAYIHTELSELDLPHGDLKSSNVLLTPDFEPRLSDYGLCSLLSRSSAAQALVAFKSPEAILHQIISPKCDVYCLGIIILEIVTGKFPSQYLNSSQGGTDLVQWVRSAIAEGREAELLHPDISNAGSFVNEMVQLLHIGAACTESNPDQRPDLLEATRRIEGLSVGGSGRQTRTFNVLPSLRDGYADQVPVEPQAPALASFNDRSVRRRDSGGEVSGRKSFAFETS